MGYQLLVWFYLFVYLLCIPYFQKYKPVFFLLRKKHVSIICQIFIQVWYALHYIFLNLVTSFSNLILSTSSLDHGYLSSFSSSRNFQVLCCILIFCISPYVINLLLFTFQPGRCFFVCLSVCLIRLARQFETSFALGKFSCITSSIIFVLLLSL